MQHASIKAIVYNEQIRVQCANDLQVAPKVSRIESATRIGTIKEIMILLQSDHECAHGVDELRANSLEAPACDPAARVSTSKARIAV